MHAEMSGNTQNEIIHILTSLFYILFVYCEYTPHGEKSKTA